MLRTPAMARVSRRSSISRTAQARASLARLGWVTTGVIRWGTFS